MAEDLPLVGADDPRHVDERLFDVADARKRAVEGEKEHQRCCEDDLGHQVNAEPDDKQRRQRDARDAVERGEVRIEDSGSEPPLRQQDAENDTATGATEIAGAHFDRGDPQVAVEPRAGKILEQHGGDARRRSHVKRIKQHAGSKMPERQEREKKPHLPAEDDAPMIARRGSRESRIVAVVCRLAGTGH